MQKKIWSIGKSLLNGLVRLPLLYNEKEKSLCRKSMLLMKIF
jgi:hypothetical protein